MKIHHLPPEEVLPDLGIPGEGLSQEEVRRRLREYGPNEIREVRKDPLYLKLLRQFTHFLAVLLWIAAALCLVSDYLKPGEGMFSLGVAIVGVIIINAVFTFIQEYRAERAVAALRRLLPFDVKVLREGVVQEVPAREVVPGDIFFLEEGDKVPGDGRLLEVQRLMMNHASLTGESDPLSRSDAPFPGDYSDSPNLVFAGTTVISGSGRAVALATGMATEFGKIAHLTSAVDPGLTPLQKEIIRVTRIIAVIALTSGVFFFSLGYFLGMSFWHNFLFAVGITIANVPEGLLPTVTLALAMGSQRLARKKALIKNLNSVETLGSVTVICSDKTGTLTQNRMAVRNFWWLGRDAGPSDAARTWLLKIAYLCNNAVYEDGQYRGDPTEAALLQGAREELGEFSAERLAEVPFDSDRKRMTTVNRVEQETWVLTKGALETVLPLCGHILRGNQREPLTEGNKQTLLQAYHSLMDEGLRVIAFAWRELGEGEEGISRETLGREDFLEKDLVFVGLVGLEDPPRPEVKEAIRKCREAGIKAVMITGDAGRTALAIAREIGLVRHEPEIIEGDKLDLLSDRELRKILLAPEVVFARMAPRHKMRIVSVLKDEGERVAVTGDGVNDAPALKKADIGIAMGVVGTDVAREAADVVLLDDNFATIVNAVEEGRAIFENIRKFIIYIFAHLTPEAVPYVLYSMFTIPLPLTVMQILAIDLGTETVPALALGVEKPEADIMKYRPTYKRLIDLSALFRGYVFLGLISTMGVLSVYFYVLYTGGWHWGQVLPWDAPLARQAATATFLGIVIMQIGNVFACRSSTLSICRIGFFSNKLVLLGVLVEVLLAVLIIYHPLGQWLFGTAPLSWRVWVILLPFSAALLLAEELRKVLVRRALARRG
ncbi:MAG: cation-transporting P-type ATPase [Thermodesulfobacteriota bacterium]